MMNTLFMSILNSLAKLAKGKKSFRFEDAWLGFDKYEENVEFD